MSAFTGKLYAWRTVTGCVLLAVFSIITRLAFAAPNSGGTWQTVASLPIAESPYLATTGTDGKIYALQSALPGIPSTNFLRYDPTTNIWSSLPPMPTSRASFALIGGADGKIYVLGGSIYVDHLGPILSTVEAYDIENNVWTCSVGDTAAGCASSTLSPIPTARIGAIAVRGVDDLIYLLGGLDENLTYSDAVDAYDPVNNTWQSLAHSGTQADGKAIVGPDGRIYVIGGTGCPAGVCAEKDMVQIYDPVTNLWTSGAPMPYTRSQFAIALGADSLIYVIGGLHQINPYPNPQYSILSSVLTYNVQSNTWSEAPSLPFARHVMGGATDPQGRIYAIAGALCLCTEYETTVQMLDTSIGGGPMSISGQVADNNGVAMPGVLLTTNGNDTAITDASGVFTLTNLITGTYTVTPTLGGYTFTPTSRTVNVPPPAANQDFAGQAVAGNASIVATARAGYANVVVTWDWTAAIPDIAGLVGYQVSRSANSQPYAALTDTPLLTSQYLDSAGLTNGVAYCYKVEAVNATGGVLSVSNLPCVTFGQLLLWSPNVVAPPGAYNVIVPVNLSNGGGLCIGALQLTLSYNQSIAVATGTVSPTIFTEGYSFVANTGTPGRVTIAAISSSCQSLYGAGTLFKVGFDVVGLTGQTTPLDFVTGLTATVLYADDDLVTPVPLTLQSGSLTARTAYVTGDVNGDTVVNVADAALALQIASGTHAPTWDQAGACDVNGDAACDAADASLLLCFVAFGSWESCGAPTANLAAPAADLTVSSVVTVSLGAVNGGVGQTITVPVTLVGGSEFAGGTFSFQYDPTRMTFVSSAKTSLTTAFSVRSHTQWPGLVRIAMASKTALGSDGTILNLRFQLTGAPAPIGLAQYWLNDSSGRDFQTSALQKSIVVVGANPGPGDPYRLFLPVVVR